MRVATIDQYVVSFQMLRQLCDGLVDNSGWKHQPDDARRGENRYEVLQGFDALRASFDEGRHRIAIHVIDDALMTSLEETAGNIGAHTPEADNGNLHGSNPFNAAPVGWRRSNASTQYEHPFPNERGWRGVFVHLGLKSHRALARQSRRQNCICVPEWASRWAGRK